MHMTCHIKIVKVKVHQSRNNEVHTTSKEKFTITLPKCISKSYCILPHTEFPSPVHIEENEQWSAPHSSLSLLICFTCFYLFLVLFVCFIIKKYRKELRTIKSIQDKSRSVGHWTSNKMHAKQTLYRWSTMTWCDVCCSRAVITTSPSLHSAATLHSNLNVFSTQIMCRTKFKQRIFILKFLKD